MGTTNPDPEVRHPEPAADEQHPLGEFAQFIEALKQNIDLKVSNAVLVVEDSGMMRQLVAKFILKAMPLVRVIEAENGRHGLRKLEWIRQATGRDPLLIVSDLDMPVMDGWEFIAELKKDYEGKGRQQGTPLIVLSSTEGKKGRAFSRRSIRSRRCDYSPMVAVAKSSCVNPKLYDAIGNKGLVAWIEFFLLHDQV